MKLCLVFCLSSELMKYIQIGWGCWVGVAELRSQDSKDTVRPRSQAHRAESLEMESGNPQPYCSPPLGLSVAPLFMEVSLFCWLQWEDWSEKNMLVVVKSFYFSKATKTHPRIKFKGTRVHFNPVYRQFVACCFLFPWLTVSGGLSLQAIFVTIIYNLAS